LSDHYRYQYVDRIVAGYHFHIASNLIGDTDKVVAIVFESNATKILAVVFPPVNVKPVCRTTVRERRFFLDAYGVQHNVSLSDSCPQVVRAVATKTRHNFRIL
jgi:hypothetical protein